MKNDLIEIAKHVIVFLCIWIVVCMVWRSMVVFLFGEYTPRVVDDIISFLFAWSLHFNFKGFLVK